MDGYQVLVIEDFWNTAKRNVPEKYHNLIKKKLEYLKANPKHPSLNTKTYHCSSKIKEALQKQGVDEICEFYVNFSDF